MRLFLGIPLSGDALRAAADARARYSELPVRWVPNENLHVTLVPPWEGEELAAEVRRVRAALPTCTPFSISFREVALGPNPRDPRMVWLKGQAPPELIELHRRLMAGFGFPLVRPYRLHATLARFRDGAAVARGFVPWAVRCAYRVNRVVLYQSELLPEGARYTAVDSFTITA